MFLLSEFFVFIMNWHSIISSIAIVDIAEILCFVGFVCLYLLLFDDIHSKRDPCNKGLLIPGYQVW
ncbi:hypothetical protein BGI40_01095 [Snodgrassella communis]|nr:hypothetical protein BGI38_11035 [Snodgrassella communis]PIT26115.1 hypothetical protein BGI39_10530 [Snodgrassella communis]PIT37382.1 hypothetical protein BGI40_01095 [Snodgrassella communis]